MKLYNKDGVEMMDVKSIDLQNDILIIKGKMMGSMATTLIVKPSDMWSAFKLFPFFVKLRIPLLLIKGWKEQRSISH